MPTPNEVATPSTMTSELITNPKKYVLQAIVGYKTNEYKSFGELHAKHVDDIARLLENYAIEVAENIIGRIGRGEIKLKKQPPLK